jgi:hypothetical protein
MSASVWSAALAPNLWEMKVAWALLRICAGDSRFVGYYPHEQAEVIEFCKYLDFEPTGEDVARARGILGELREAA